MSNLLNKGLFTSDTNRWETPQWLFDRLDFFFNFTIDVCADETNHKCERYFDESIDGLKQSWAGQRAWCNPPYGSELKRWIRKAAETVELFPESLVVMLIPARVETQWYHKWIANNPNATVIFLEGRLRFSNSKCNAPFPSMVVIFMNFER